MAGDVAGNFHACTRCNPARVMVKTMSTQTSRITVVPTQVALEGGNAVVTCNGGSGGTLVNAKDKGANMSGTAIKGGHAQKLSKGDYALVPSNTPHWYSDVRGEFAIVTMHMPMAAQ